jgi:hypothetical protein
MRLSVPGIGVWQHSLGAVTSTYSSSPAKAIDARNPDVKMAAIKGLDVMKTPVSVIDAAKTAFCEVLCKH